VHREVREILRGYRVVPCARRGLGERPAKGRRALVSFDRLPPPPQRRVDRPQPPADGRRIGYRIAERHQDRPQFLARQLQLMLHRANRSPARVKKLRPQSHLRPLFLWPPSQIRRSLSQFRTPPVKFGRHPRLGPGLRRRRAAKIRYSSRWVRSSRSWRSCASTLKVAMGRASRRRRLIGSAVSSQ